MRGRRNAVFGLGVGLILCTARLAFPNDLPPGSLSLAVLPFSVDEQVAESSTGRTIAESIAAQAGLNDKQSWAVEDKETVQRAMKSDEFRGRPIDDNYAVAIGKRLHVQYVVYGTLGKTGFSPPLILYGRRIVTDRLAVVERQFVEFEGIDLLKTKVGSLLARLEPWRVLRQSYGQADRLLGLQPSPLAQK